MIILIFFTSALGYITFDADKSTAYSYFSTCFDGASFPTQIHFNGVFENISQIIIAASSIFKVLYNIQGYQPNEFTFTVSDITYTSFYVTLTCIQSYRLSEMIFRWAAIDDRRIQVITDLVNTSSIITQSKTYIYSLDNPNFSQGFISVNSFGFGLLDFTLTIDSISYNEVSVTISTINADLTQDLSIGFQVVLGTAEAINQSSIIDWTITKSSPYVSETLTVSPGYKLILPVCGLKHFSGNSLAYYQNYYDYTDTTGEISYLYGSTWNGYIVDRISFRESWINTQITKIINPFLCKKLRITSIFDNKYENGPNFQLYVAELNQNFDSTSGTQKFLIEPTTQKLDMLFTYKCIPIHKVQGQILKCKSCSKSNHIIKQNCYGSINKMTVSVQFYRSDQVYTVIYIETTSSGFIIKTEVQNKNVESYTLIDTSISLI